MTFAPERTASRRDLLIFGVCLTLSILARIAPTSLGVAVASGFRRTLLAPLLALEHQAELTKTSRADFAAVRDQRDSLVLATDSLASLRLENRQLKDLLGLRGRLPPVTHVAAQILHQAGPGEAMLTLSVGRAQGVRPFFPVISAEGLVGVIRDVDTRTSVMMVWSHSDFRASAMTEDGSVYGIIAPAGTAGPNQMLMELSGVPYREDVPAGTAVYTSGLGGVYPRGIPLGQVIAVGTEQEGWSRTYIVRPAVHPASVSHVIVLIGDAADLRPAFPPTIP